MPATQSSVITGPDETAMKMSAAGHAFNSEAYDNFIPSVRTPIGAGSGGTQLQNWPGGKLIVRSASGNSIMFMGGIGQHAPFSGRGLSLYGGETVTVPIKNANRISFMASVSGQFIEYGMFITANTSEISVDLSGIYRPSVDITPPTLVSVQPISGVSGVEHNATISATFDEAIAASTINTTSFTVRLSGAGQPLVSGIAFISESDPTNAIFSPYSGQISGSLIYVARLGTQIQDLAGNALAASAAWHWTTIAGAPPPDTTLPNISGAGVASGATNVDVSTSKNIFFSEALQSGSINSSKIYLELSGVAVPANVTLQSNLTTVTISPIDNLDYVKTYTETVLSGAVLDLAGNAFSGTWQRPFTTEEPSWNIPYSVSLESNDHNLDHDRFAVSEAMTTSAPYPLSGKNIQKVTVFLAKEGSPISDASGGQVYIRKADGSRPTPSTFGYFNPATLPATHEGISLVNTDITYEFQVGDKVEVGWISGNSSDKVSVAVTTASQFVGGRVQTYDGATYSGASYTNKNSEDLVGTFFSTN